MSDSNRSKMPSFVKPESMTNCSCSVAFFCGQMFQLDHQSRVLCQNYLDFLGGGRHAAQILHRQIRSVRSVAIPLLCACQSRSTHSEATAPRSPKTFSTSVAACDQTPDGFPDAR